MTSNRVQCIGLTLTGYLFDVENISSKDNVADYLSLNPNISNTNTEPELPSHVYLNYLKIPLTEPYS